ncbi:hypothetical protein GCM10010447_19320 [Streptomyces fulvorobeus]
MRRRGEAYGGHCQQGCGGERAYGTVGHGTPRILAPQGDHGAIVEFMQTSSMFPPNAANDKAESGYTLPPD